VRLVSNMRQTILVDRS